MMIILNDCYPHKLQGPEEKLKKRGAFRYHSRVIMIMIIIGYNYNCFDENDWFDSELL